VARNYDAIATCEPGRVRVIDASQKIEAVVEDALAQIRKIL